MPCWQILSVCYQRHATFPYRAGKPAWPVQESIQHQLPPHRDVREVPFSASCPQWYALTAVQIDRCTPSTYYVGYSHREIPNILTFVPTYIVKIHRNDVFRLNSATKTFFRPSGIANGKCLPNIVDALMPPLLTCSEYLFLKTAAVYDFHSFWSTCI